MAKNSIHFNEFKLEFINGVYKLIPLGRFKERYPSYDEELIWMFVKNNLSYKEQSEIPNGWIFFINDKNKISGFARRYGSFSRMGNSDILRKIVMSGAEKVVLVMEYELQEKRGENYHPTVITNYFQDKLMCFNISIIDTLLVNQFTHFSLKKNSLI